MKDQKSDVYTRVTNTIIASLEQGVRPWIKPWSAGHIEGRIERPLRHNGEPYRGINVLMLWGEAMERGFGAPTWMTFKQAQELGANVRKGEKGSPVVYANTLRRSEEDEGTGEAQAREIAYLKAYTVSNVEQIEGLPERYSAAPTPRLEPAIRNAAADQFFATIGADVRHGGNRACYAGGSDHIQMPPLRRFAIPKATTRRSRMSASTGQCQSIVLIVVLAASAGAMRATPWRNSLPNSVRPSCVSTSI